MSLRIKFWVSHILSKAIFNRVPLYPDGYIPMKYTEHVHITTLFKDKLSFWLLQNIKVICQNYLKHNTHKIFGNYWQVHISKCYPGSCSWATGPEKPATAFKNTALDVLRTIHLFKEGKDNRNYIYFPINNYCTKCSECNTSVKLKKR